MPKRNFEINVDLKYSYTFRIKAGTKAEAKNKALEKFRKRIKKKDLEFYVDELDEYGYLK